MKTLSNREYFTSLICKRIGLGWVGFTSTFISFYSIYYGRKKEFIKSRFKNKRTHFDF